MLSGKYLLLAYFSGFIISNFHQASYAKQQQQKHPYCDPSFCGNIHNISYPFRLKNDPEHCGLSGYQLECEKNTPSIYLQSHKYHVQEINYHNYTIRLADSELTYNDTCSFPLYSLDWSDPILTYPYTFENYYVESPLWTVTFLSCPYPLNDSIFTETDHCININDAFNASFSSKRNQYIKVGQFDASDVRNMCSIDVQVRTSLPFRDEKNSSLSEIHASLIYGFEISWLNMLCGPKCRVCRFDGKRARCKSYWCNNAGSREEVVCGPYSLRYHAFWRVAQIPALVRVLVVFHFALRILIGVPFLIGLIVYKFRRRHLSIFAAIECFLQSHNNLVPVRYSYSHIKKMTKGFQEKLGQGGYGSVYKAKLQSGNNAAVKLLTKPTTNGQDFINEVATIGRIHHINVVKLIGYCVEGSKCALVYDFMPNGSLEKYIFRGRESLNWSKKYDIAIGVARGIEYLHRGCDIQILHFDIKPHNILLDRNFTPKISDFGLAKFYPTEKNTVTLTAARGTIGYVAPELINRSIGEVSYKADVYSFGMLLVEMVGLKRDLVGNDGGTSMYFPDWIYDRFEKGKDIEMGNIVDDSDDGFTSGVMRKITIVALWCIQMSPEDRPSMSKVLEMLESEGEMLQIPTRTCQPTQDAPSEDLTWGTESSDSIALMNGGL